MKRETGESVVGLYWDFENVHASLHEAANGRNTYIRTRYQPQAVLVNIKAVMDYAATIGVIAINKAYADWQWFAPYRDELNLNGLDLIPHFPRGLKNGADIRLALDVLEDLYHYPHITHVIVVGSDSDYISLAQKVKQSGRTIIGVGVQANANLFWIQCCNEFKFYHTLLKRAEVVTQPVVEETNDRLNLEDAKKLMVEALRRLVARHGANAIPRSSLKVLMLRIDPSFDEANYGYSSFSAFVKAFPDIVENIRNNSGGIVKLLPAKPRRVDKVKANAVVQIPKHDVSETYLKILKTGGVRPLPTAWWRRAVVCVDLVFAEAGDNLVPSFEDFKQALAARLRENRVADDPALINKLRYNLMRLQQFQLNGEGAGIGLRARQQGTGKDLLSHIEEEIVRRIVRFATPPVDEAAIAALIYGEQTAEKVREVRRLISSVQSVDGGPPLIEGSLEV